MSLLQLPDHDLKQLLVFEELHKSLSFGMLDDLDKI
jgi:hypothetical protein